jgi:hypothetical protein
MRIPLVLMEDNNFRVTGKRPDVRKNQENEAARVLIGIVVVFLICHVLRVTTDFYEMIYIEDITSCYREGKDGVHLWVHVVNEFSSAMVTLNSSVNMIIYGLIKPNIRKHIFLCKKKNTFYQETQSQNEETIQMRDLMISPPSTLPTTI